MGNMRWLELEILLELVRNITFNQSTTRLDGISKSNMQENSLKFGQIFRPTISILVFLFKYWQTSIDIGTLLKLVLPCVQASNSACLILLICIQLLRCIHKSSNSLSILWGTSALPLSRGTYFMSRNFFKMTPTLTFPAWSGLIPHLPDPNFPSITPIAIVPKARFHQFVY